MAKLLLCVSMMLVLLVALGECGFKSPCCSQYQQDPVPVKLLKIYKPQDSNYCNLKAIIFKTIRNRIFCANPEDKWVIDAMETVPYKP